MEFSNWLRRVIWGRILRGRHHGTRLWNSADAKWLWRILQSRMLKATSCGRNCVYHYPSINCLFSVFSNINGEPESTLTTSKKYSWCIPVQKEIKPIIWGAAITPEPWNRQQCWFIFEDPNVRVARLLESLGTMKVQHIRSTYSIQGTYALSAPANTKITTNDEAWRLMLIKLQLPGS